MTGLNPARIGITSPTCHLVEEIFAAAVPARGPATEKTVSCRSATRLVTDYYTLAEALHDAGYATGHFGKWHLGREPYDPLHHGFDIDVPHWPGPGPAGSYVAPWKFPNFREGTPQEHIEDRMGDEAAAFIREHQDTPFFLNYWQFSVHAPFDAKASLIEKHRQRVNPDDPQRSPTYAAMVESLDDNVGKILDTLDELTIADRTIIVFYSDNGGNMYNEIDGTTPTSNAPLRGGKATMYEGGIRVPCIVCWPGVVAGQSTNDTMIQSTDLYPTLLEMLGLAPQEDQKFDGLSIVPTLRDSGSASELLSERAIFTFFPHSPKVPDHLPPAAAVHRGDWKLIRVFHDGDAGGHRYELYNLREDLGERHNLAAEHPDLVRELDALIEQFLLDTEAVRPIPNPDYDPGSIELARRSITNVNQCRLIIQNGQLHMHASGGDPHFVLRLDEPIAAAPLTLRIRMKTSDEGPGHAYWQEQSVNPQFHASRRVPLNLQSDGAWHDYQVVLAAQHPTLSIRLDPLNRPGEVVIDFVHLEDDQGHLLHAWDFD
jgi:arylsulfatase A-like enzyme